MKLSNNATLVALILLLARMTLSLNHAEDAPRDVTPIGAKWWPSEWGPTDERGAANRLTDEKVLEATRLIRKGKVYSLGRLYEHGMPLAGQRHFSLVIPGSPTGVAEGENGVVHHDEMFSGEIGQIGTQFDGLGHIGVRCEDDDYFYNGFRLSKFRAPYGLLKLGVHNAGPIFTRGVLLDIARLRGVNRMPIGDVITPEDIQSAMRKQNVTIRPGDVVLFRTGHGQLWMRDNDQFSKGEPGLGLAGAKWLIEQKIVMAGADTWAMEVVPSENPKRPFEVHQWLLAKNGIYILENIDLETLAADRVYEFAFIFAPLSLKGASGSPGNPIAVR